MMAPSGVRFIEGVWWRETRDEERDVCRVSEGSEEADFCAGNRSRPSGSFRSADRRRTVPEKEC